MEYEFETEKGTFLVEEKKGRKKENQNVSLEEKVEALQKQGKEK